MSEPVLTSQKASFKERFKATKEKINYRNITVDLSKNHDGSMMRVIRKKRPIGVWIALAVVLALFVGSWFFVPAGNFSLTFEGVANTLKKLFTLDPNSYASLRTQERWNAYLWGTAVPAIWATTEMCFIATVFGAIFSIPLYYLAARNVAKHAYIYQPVRIICDLIRTIPTMIIAIFVILFFGKSNLSGIIAMAVFTAGIMYQLMYEYIETLEMSPFEAIDAAGGRTLQNVNLGLHPEIKPMFYANFLYTFEINIRASVILGYVGAGGFGIILDECINAEQYDRVGCMLIPLFVLVFVLQIASNIVSRKMK